MIQFFKNAQKSWVTKGFLGLLTLSFGIWGIGDFLNHGLSAKIALSVGGTEIGIEEVQARFSRELDRVKQSMGGVIESEEIKRSVLNTTVQDMTRDAALNEAADDLGLVLTTQHLRDSIRQDPSFRDESGKFNQLVYFRVLSDNNLTEKGFLKLYSSSLRARAILTPVFDNTNTPKALVDNLFAFRGETRIADTLLVTAASVPAPPAATEDELKKAYDDNIASFTAPEYRKVQAVVIRSDELVSPDSFSDEQLKSYYDENIERYRTRETKRIAQIVFDTKEQAEAARAMAATGDHLDDVARKAKASVVDLGELAKTSPLLKSVGPAYDLPVGEISQPIQTDLGWHLFEVKDVQPEVVRDFDAVRGEIRKTLAADKGTDALYDASQTLEDSVSAGEAMESVASKVNGKLISVDAMDRDGRDPHGIDAKGLIDNARFMKTAFALTKGSESKLLDIPNGYYMMRVEDITPATPKPFDEVRKDVVGLADKQKRLVAARAQADKIVAAVTPGTQLQAIAVAAGSTATAAPVGPVNRFGQPLSKDIIVDSKRIGPELLDKLFAAKVGDVVSAPVVDGVVVARLREINPPAAAQVAQEESQLTANLRIGIGNDLAGAVVQAFAERYPVKRNDSTLDSLASSTR